MSGKRSKNIMNYVKYGYLIYRALKLKMSITFET